MCIVWEYSDALYFCSYLTSLHPITTNSPLLPFLDGLKLVDFFLSFILQADSGWLWCFNFHFLNTPSHFYTYFMPFVIVWLLIVFIKHRFTVPFFTLHTTFYRAVLHVFSLSLPWFLSNTPFSLFHPVFTTHLILHINNLHRHSIYLHSSPWDNISNMHALLPHVDSMMREQNWLEILSWQYRVDRPHVILLCRTRD